MNQVRTSLMKDTEGLRWNLGTMRGSVCQEQYGEKAIGCLPPKYVPGY